jgi:hypothetical protein
MALPSFTARVVTALKMVTALKAGQLSPEQIGTLDSMVRSG